MGRVEAHRANHPTGGSACGTTAGECSSRSLADHTAHDAGGKLPEEYLDTLIPPRTPSGRPIQRRHIPHPTPTEILSLVARNEIVHPSIASLPDYVRHPGVAYVPIRGLPPSEAGLIWSTARETAAIRAFAAVAHGVLDEIPYITARG